MAISKDVHCQGHAGFQKCSNTLQAEEAVTVQRFASTFIFRPGLLDRGATARRVEQWASKILNAMPVKVLATAMILEAQAGQAGVHVYEGRDIAQAANSTPGS